MSDLSGEARTRYVRAMFGRIAPRYDLLNRLMTAGQDRRWRREALRRMDLPAAPVLLDLGAGTGDLGFEALAQRPAARVVALDFTPEMLRLGRRRPGGEHVQWVLGDAAHLPFPAASFDGLVSGFLLRNVAALEAALGEQRRVLRPGARVACLDTTPAPRSWLLPALRFHLHTVIPALGRLIAGDSQAYNYLPQSTERFVTAEALAAHLRAAGFQQVGFVRRMLGTIAIHWGTAARE